MFVDAASVDLLDLLLEGAKALVMLVLVVIMYRAGGKYPQLASGPWGLITSGFLLMFIGFLFDWSDEFVNYDASVMAAQAEAIIEETSLIIGLIMVTVGFGKWFVFVARFMGLEEE